MAVLGKGSLNTSFSTVCSTIRQTNVLLSDVDTLSVWVYSHESGFVLCFIEFVQDVLLYWTTQIPFGLYVFFHGLLDSSSPWFFTFNSQCFTVIHAKVTSI